MCGGGRRYVHVLKPTWPASEALFYAFVYGAACDLSIVCVHFQTMPYFLSPTAGMTLPISRLEGREQGRPSRTRPACRYHTRASIKRDEGLSHISLGRSIPAQQNAPYFFSPMADMNLSSFPPWRNKTGTARTHPMSMYHTHTGRRNCEW